MPLGLALERDGLRQAQTHTYLNLDDKVECNTSV